MAANSAAVLFRQMQDGLHVLRRAAEMLKQLGAAEFEAILREQTYPKD